MYLGIIVPIYLKHCAIGPYLGTHNLTTIILGHTKMCIFSLLSIYWPATLGTQNPSRYFFHPYPHLFSSSSSFPSISQILHGSSKFSLELQDFSRIKAREAKGLNLLKTWKLPPKVWRVLLLSNSLKTWRQRARRPNFFQNQDLEAKRGSLVKIKGN